jgi:A/G-specific adenine glycosylase
MGEKWFSERLINWYSENKRKLPWRGTKDPYKIWLSEIILQQTRVEQGLPYYNKFVKAFPLIQDLAEAPENKVLRLWQGLGYYSRARNLQVAAKYVINDLKGVFPQEFKDLLLLKGVRQYTAAAIASFAYNESVAVVDGNVYRVLSRIFNDNTDISSGKGQKHFFALASELIDSKNPAIFNQAIMEFGALHCTPKSPDCERCIFSDKCMALDVKTVTQLPYKKAKVKVKNLFLYLFILRCNDTICLMKRDNSSIWKGLYEFPNLVFDTRTRLKDSQIEDFLNKMGLEFSLNIKELGAERIHKLSHRTLHAQFYEVEIKKLSKNLTPLFYKIEELKELPKPVLIDKILLEYFF